MTNPLNICVFCGSKFGSSEHYSEAAEQLGEAIANHGCSLVFGGGNTGLMGLVSQSCLRRGGRVTGVITKGLIDREKPSDNLSELFVMDSMSERKQKMSELADCFVVLPGGFGTMDETFEVLTNNLLKIASKPVALVNTDNYNGLLLDFMNHAADEGFMGHSKINNIIVSDDADRVVAQLIERASK